MLVEDLNEIDLDNEEDLFEANLKNVEEGGEDNKGEHRKEKPKHKNSEDNDDDDDEVNISDDIDDEMLGKEKSDAFKIHLSHPKNRSKLAAPEITGAENYDFQIMDELFAFLDLGQEEMQPILCGYFNKIVQSLLNKVKSKLLSYVLLKRGGDIFNKLLDHLHHHSLALLMIELLQVKVLNVEPRDRFNSDFDSESDKKEGEDKDKGGEPKEEQKSTNPFE